MGCCNSNWPRSPSPLHRHWHGSPITAFSHQFLRHCSVSSWECRIDERGRLGSWVSPSHSCFRRIIGHLSASSHTRRFWFCNRICCSPVLASWHCCGGPPPLPPRGPLLRVWGAPVRSPANGSSRGCGWVQPSF